MKKSIIITGASGFIGSWVVRRLYRQYKVIATVSPYSTSSRLEDIKKNIAIEKINLTDYKSVEKLIALHKPFAVLHLATHGVYTYQQKDFDRIVVDNYVMANNLISASVTYSVNRFVNTGSVFEYGSRYGKVKEGDVDLTDILNKYSAIKMATTALANSYADEIKVLTLRPFTTYGPGEDETRFMAATIKRAKINEPIKLIKNVVRDFVFAEDVSKAYELALTCNFESGEIINIGSGKKATLGAAATLIKKLTKSESEIVFDDTYLRKKESKCWADITRAKNVLGWKPSHTLLMGLQKMI